MNVTPDSFYDGGEHNDEKGALKHAARMVEMDADMIDIGGYSSRPGAAHIDESEERERVMPCIRAIKREFPDLVLSIDTFRSAIAEEAVGEGAAIINDISGGEMDSQMFSTVSKLGVPYIVMHMRGTPQNMQEDTLYENLTNEMFNYFQAKLQKLQHFGVNDVIIDPGFGFGKDLYGNFQVLQELKSLQLLERPVLVGLSRKSMISKLLGAGEEAILRGTMALNLIALVEGASILRVHDVKEGKEIAALYQRLKGAD